MKIKLKQVFLLFFLLGIVAATQAQSHKIDSLRSLLYNTSDEHVKLKALISLCEHGGVLPADTISKYLDWLRRADAGKNKKILLDVEYYQTGILAKKEKIDTAILIVERVLAEYPKKYANKDIWLRFSMQKARLYDRKNEYTKSITQLHEVLNAAELWEDTLTMVQAETGIGWVQMEMEQYRDALTWFHRALAKPVNAVFMKEYSALYSNIASAYNKIGKNDSAQLFINKAIAYGRETESLTFLATSLNIAADIYTDTKQMAKAEASLHEALQIRKLINDPYYTLYDLSRLANWYAVTGNPAKGIELCKTGIELASQSGLSSQLQLMYYALAENYKAAGNTGMYGSTLEKIIALKDSFTSINSSNLLTELQAKYDAQKQENTIIQQRLNISQKNNAIYISLGLLLLTGVVIYFIFRDYRRKQRLKLFRIQEEEKRMAEKAVQEAEEKERKRIAADLHDNLGTYANAVLHGTELLQQENVNHHNKELVKNLNTASKEVIVSLRETIWALKKENYTAEECLLRIRNFTQPLNRYYPGMIFEVKGDAPVYYMVHYSKALHIVRMVQEAITNAVRHSSAKNIIVLSETVNGEWKLKVIDDGNGFSVTDKTGEGDHNGLINLRERAKAADIGLSIESEKNKGTLVELSVKLN